MLQSNRSSRSLAFSLLALISSGLSLTACAPAAQPTSDTAQAVQQLASGALIEKMNQAAAAPGTSTPTATAEEESPLLNPTLEDKTQLAARLNAMAVGTQESEDDEAPASITAATPRPAADDPCPEVGIPAAGATREELLPLLRAFSSCMSTLAGKGFALNHAFELYKLYSVAPGTAPYSQMTEEELADLVMSEEAEHPLRFLGTNHPVLSRIRSQYTDSELLELRQIAQARRAAFELAEEKIVKAARARRPLFEAFQNVDRWAVFLMMLDSATTKNGAAVVAAASAHPTLRYLAPRAAELPEYPFRNLHPYAFLGIIPSAGKEADRLNPSTENPFTMAKEMIYEMDDEDLNNLQNIQTYSFLRDIQHPIPAHETAKPDAARVAIIDTGADYFQFPELGQFLARGSEGTDTELKSYDLNDRDSNPWMVSLGMFGHGSGVMASVLSVAAHSNPELLTEHRIDIAMWKNSTFRSLLSGEDPNQFWRFNGLGVYGLHDGINRGIADFEAGKPVPHIVSMSLAFGSWSFRNTPSQRDFLKRAPWLWVMAAGNSAKDIAAERRTCFADVPSEYRVDANILCVGALDRGITGDQIAQYSNYGARVDVYAYDTYTRTCPNGTSCATPAVSSAAAVLKAKFPALTAAQLKQAIVAASEERSLAVQGRTASSPLAAPQASTLRRTVRVFDPATMIPKALEQAQIILTAQTATVTGE